MAPSKKHRKEFLEISVLLTGFNHIELEATGMTDTYLETVVARTHPSTLGFFFKKVEALLNLPPQEQSPAITAQLIPDSAYNGLAKRIILMWYEGQWTVGDNTEVISSQSYIEGLMWPAAKTHPSGAKQAGFGSWAKRPL
jgi:hypothetical protein